MRYKWICYSHRKFKANIKLWIYSEKIHRKAEFNEKGWLKPCIFMNTKLRQKAKNNFEKDTFKLMKNSVKNYGECKKR